MAFNWTCPHCGTPQAVAGEKYKVYFQRIYIEDQAEGKIGARIAAVGCVAPECLRHTVLTTIGGAAISNGSWALADQPILFDGALYPQGASKPQPSFIPAALREDYVEACLIRDLSPKAAATLVRRCLQGMIRDFAGIAKGTLNEEIKALRAAVDNGDALEGVSHDSVDAIDAVRDIGNIGAHMEKDINMVVDVDPGEAQALIELVEMLFDEWYVARDRRQKRLKAISEMAAAKKQDIADMKAAKAAAEAVPTLGASDDAAPDA